MKNYNNLLNSLLEKSTFVSYSSSDPNQTYNIMFSGISTQIHISSNKTNFFHVEFSLHDNMKTEKNVVLSNLEISTHEEFIQNLIKKHQYFINGSYYNPEIDKVFLSYLDSDTSLEEFLTVTEKNIRGIININNQIKISSDQFYTSSSSSFNQLSPLKFQLVKDSTCYTVIIPKYQFSRYPIFNYLSHEIIVDDADDVLKQIKDKKFLSLFEHTHLLDTIDKKNKTIDTKKSKI